MKQHLPCYQLLDNSLQTIAVVRSLPGLGDLLCCIPALRALRVAYPEARIHLIGLPSTKTLIRRFSHYLDQWLEFPGFPGIPEATFIPSKTVAFLKIFQELEFDLAIQMHGNGSIMNNFVALLGAKQSAGYFSINHPWPDSNGFIPYPDRLPEIWRNLQLIESLGIPLQGTHLEFPIWKSDWQALEPIAANHSLKWDHYICIHPGASVSSRRWSYLHFAAVADTLAAQGWQIVLTGTAAEAELTQAVAEAMRFPAIDLAGQTSLGELAALLKRSRLLICNDTGVSHLAAALQVNSVVIFSNSDPQRWAPLDRQRHCIVQMPAPIKSASRDSAASNPVSFTDHNFLIAPVLTAAIALLQSEARSEAAYAS
jgi:ADP-heptose:LPS heptosyltransferase